MLGILLMDIRDSLSSNPTKTPAYFGTPSDDSVISVQTKQGLDASHSLIETEVALSTYVFTEIQGDAESDMSSELIEAQQSVRPKLIPQKICDQKQASTSSLFHKDTVNLPGQQKQQSQSRPKHGMITNIKDMLANQKEKSKRKSSKTPGKETGAKFQKHQK